MKSRNELFLVDESSGKRLADLLSKAGFDTKYVGDILQGADDDAVLSLSEKEKRILITDDKDFGELIFRLRMPSAGVILIRTATSQPIYRLNLIKSLLQAASVKGKFVVLKESGARIRGLK